MAEIDGILLLDKPAGMTSHDVVARARRALGTREVGHAGTLDPMATGLLVVLVGEATKLSAYLTTDEKAYDATVRFGAATDTLDADGEVVARSDAPAPDEVDVRAALAAMVGPMQQVPPVVSAIKQGGVALHVRARRGETVEVAPRDVELREAVVRAVRPGECDLSLRCSKGFYVRSLARDLAERLGTLGHLGVLRRTAAGPFGVSEALGGDRLQLAARGDAAARDEVRAALRPLGEAARSMRALDVSPEDTLALRYGRAVAASADLAGVVLVRDPDGAPVCIGTLESGVLRVLRGIRAAGREA